HAELARRHDIHLAVIDENTAVWRQTVAFAEDAIDARIGLHQAFEAGNDDAVELFEEGPFAQPRHPLLPGEVGDGKGRDVLIDQLIMDVDRALDEGAKSFGPALVERLDLAPVFREAGDELGNALCIELACVEFEIPVTGADVLVKPERVLFALEELAEEVHRVPVDENAAQIEHRNDGIVHVTQPSWRSPACDIAFRAGQAALRD